MPYSSKGVTPTEQRLRDMGIPTSFLDSQRSKSGTANGINFDTQDFQRTVDAWKNSGGGGMSAYNQLMQGFNQKNTQIQGQFNDLLGRKFQFDPNKYLPQINQMASAIYDPQRQNIEALAELSKSDAQIARIRTEKDFAKRMQQETEAINRRGAYFSGGAIQNEQDIRTDQSLQMHQINMQDLATQAQFRAQQGMLSAEQAQYVQNELMNSQSSAYQQFLNDRGFTFDVLSKQYAMNQDERNFVRGVFESDRSFDENVRQFNMNYKLKEKEFKLMKKKFKEAKRQWGEEFAFQQFKYNATQSKKGGRGTGHQRWSNADIKASIKGMQKAGFSWDEMANALADNHVNIENGSYADRSLNTIFNPDYAGMRVDGLGVQSTTSNNNRTIR